jgi:putative ABC transport system permease protein
VIIAALLKESLQAVWMNKLRSGLTILGMVMGITSVIAIVSAVEGMQSNMESVFATMGENSFQVTRFGIITSWEEYEKKRRRKIITRDLIEPIQEGCDACEEVGAEAYASATVKYESEVMRGVQIEGHTPNIYDISDFEVASGRYFSKEDERQRKSVAFIGVDVVTELFPETDPIGKQIRIVDRRYTVIGVAKKIGSLFGQPLDGFVYLPLSTMTKQFGERGERVNIRIKAVSKERLDEAMDQTRVVMRSHRHVQYDEEDDFTILTPDAILGFINNITKAFRFIVILLPTLSIVIGGIVIMNVMLVSVTERTREIGVRKSIGASSANIRSQFLYESLLLSIVGGVLGAAFGSLLGGVLLGLMDIDSNPTALAAILGVGISSFVGIVSGMYPAMKAARLDPIQALSYE